MRIRTDQPFVQVGMQNSKALADFWDKTSDAWKTIWGIHTHHGYYDDQIGLTPIKAQQNLIEKIVEILKLDRQTKILDVGCGMGGGSLYLAKTYDVEVTGVTFSQRQLNIALEQAHSSHIQQVTFNHDDSLSLHSYANESFDVVWSLESCEQFHNKTVFLQDAFRVLKPSGKLMIATWCSDQEEYEGDLAEQYKNLCEVFELPYMPTIECYQQYLKEAHFELSHVFDWSCHVKKTWEEGISLVKKYSFIELFNMVGTRGMHIAKQVKTMRDALNQGRIKYGVFFASKP